MVCIMELLFLTWGTPVANLLMSINCKRQDSCSVWRWENKLAVSPKTIWVLPVYLSLIFFLNFSSYFPLILAWFSTTKKAIIFLAHSRKSFGWFICSTCPPRTLHHGNLNSQHNVKVSDLIPQPCTSEYHGQRHSLAGPGLLLCPRNCSTGDCSSLIGKGVWCRQPQHRGYQV